MSKQLAILIEPKKLIKAGGAYKTIGETALIIDVPQHVLRFWESKFPLILKPYKNKGRRYYNQHDLDLLFRVKELLYSKGYTIKGVQGLINEKYFENAKKSKVEIKISANDDVKNHQFFDNLLVKLQLCRDKLQLALNVDQK